MKSNRLCLFLSLTTALLLVNAINTLAQTTEGTDFWVTFLQGDSDDSENKYKLSLSISAREATTVIIENAYYGYSETITIGDNELQEVTIFDGIADKRAIRDNIKDYSANSKANGNAQYCYSYHPEMPYYSALHVKSDKPISLFASNYKKATFDATNVLPTDALLNQYIIQCYTPSDHGGSTQQGSHFAIIAVEDNTEVEYTPTVLTYKNLGYRTAKDRYESVKNDPFISEEQKQEIINDWENNWANFEIGKTTEKITLQKGQVYYVWTSTGSNEDGHDYDLSGTYIKANKKIAVFQGNPHTNLPYYKDYGETDAIRERDHLFSQAMPTGTWGSTFALVGTASRHRDIVRIMAQNDGTEVYINGTLKHTFDFSKDTKQYWEFEFGDESVTGDKKQRPKPTIVGNSCFIETTCPCAVHSFIVSRRWDGPSDNNGDPAMIWINPIEQKIDKITFATYESKNGENTKHYVNIVTDKKNAGKIKLAGVTLTGFQDIAGSNGQYQFIQHSLGSKADTYTLQIEDAKVGEGFIASIYGLTSNESYGYNAGGAAKVLTQSITINGEVFSPDKENNLCGEDTIKFACHPDYEYEKIEWYFGDGTNELSNKDSVPHFYQNTGIYNAYVLIYRESGNLCEGQSAVDSIPIIVTIGRYKFSIDDIDIPCPEDGKEYIGKVFYSNEGNVNLHGDNVIVEFDDAAIAAGFKNDELVITDNYFRITIPDSAEPDTRYGIHMVINSDCGGADTTMNFMLNYDKDVITQRYENVLGLQAEYFNNKTLSDMQWYRTSDSTAVVGQVSANLHFYDLPTGEFEDDAYYICFTINKGTTEETQTCACAKTFTKNNKKHNFGESEFGDIVAYFTEGNKIFVNADYDGQTDIECYAQWITTSGKVYQDMHFDIPNGGCTIPVPADSGLYLLRVVTGKDTRSFKFNINH